MPTNFERLLKTAGMEARRNVPIYVMVLSFLCTCSFIAFNRLTPTLLLVPLLTFALGAFAAVLSYLQRVRCDLAVASEAGATDNQRGVRGSEGGFLLEPGANLTPGVYLHQIRTSSGGMLGRLSDQVAKLGFRANLNLSVGVVICLIGFVILAYFVFIENKPGEHFDMVFRFAIRLSLVLFIEVFAFFFLSLYRAGLFDIKYFQNEMTSAAFRLAAIEVAFAKGDAAVVKKLCEELSRTERNFVLKKNETTHDLRQAEMMLENEKTIVSTLAKLMNLSSGQHEEKRKNTNIATA
jgi:hypothetical protein